MLPYVVEQRRKLHQYPEIGFDLPRTLRLVKDELTAMGIPYTERYGKSSLVAELNPASAGPTVGLRADMDALPIQEKTGLSFHSRLKGQMHACGHDAHTAILLDTARQLKAVEETLPCRVRLLFQSAEEVPPSGAKLMAEDGVMDGVDRVAALHCDPGYKTGQIGLSVGAQNAISSGFYLDFYGKTAHAARQDLGVDAIAMAVKAYTAIELMVAKELPATAVRLFLVGAIHGGETNNVVCDHARMNCTLRSWDEAIDGKITRRIRQIIAAVARESGGRARYTQHKYYPILYNDPAVTEQMRQAAAQVVGEANICLNPRGMGGEDFAYFAARKPGCMFRLGVRNEEKGCGHATHQDRFDLDEDALALGSAILVRFVMAQRTF